MLSQALLKASLIFSHIALAFSFNPSKSPVTKLTINKSAPRNTFLIISQILSKNPRIPSQIFSIFSFTESNTSLIFAAIGSTTDIIVSTKPFQASEAVSVIDSHIFTKNSEIDSQLSTTLSLIDAHSSEKNSFIAFQVLIVNSLISSQYLYITTPNATTAAITNPIGDVIVAITTPNALKPAIIVGINPTSSNKGPITNAATAANAVNLAMFSFVSLSNPLNQSTNCLTYSVTSFIVGANASPSDIAAPSSADFNSVRDPCKLSSKVSAISSADPSEFFTASAKLLYSSSLALIIANAPDIACFPKSVDAA